MNIEISAAGVSIALTGIAVIVMWLVRLEVTLANKLGIARHETICEKRDVVLQESLREIKAKIDKSDVDRQRFNETVVADLNQINVKLVTALVKADLVEIKDLINTGSGRNHITTP